MEAKVTAEGVVAFKDAAKLRTWDAPPEDVKAADGLTVLDLEKRCVTMELLRALQPFDEGEIGQLRCRTSSE